MTKTKSKQPSVLSQFSKGRIVAVALATAIGMSISGGVAAKAFSDEEPDVYVYFEDASPLIKGNDVKASGVKVGTIGSIEVDDGLAKVGLVLDDAVLPLHDDATALVRPVGLLGERYVELERGTGDAPVLDEGDVIPLEQSGRATDLDEVLNMVDAPTGTALAMLLTTLGEGVPGQGENADAAIKALAPALQDTDRLGTILADQNSVLAQLLDSVEPVATQLGSERGAQLDRLVGAADDALSATARNDEDLDSTMARLPSALVETESTLAALTGAADSTTPVLAALRPTTDDLLELSRELRAFAAAGGPALDSLEPVLDQADVLLERARPVARSLSASSGDMRATARNGRVIATGVLDNLTTVLDFVKYWALTTNGSDGLSHYFRAHVVVTTDIVGGLVPGDTDVVPELPALPDLGIDDLLENPLGNLPGGLGNLPGVLDGLTGGGRSADAGRTGLGGLLDRQGGPRRATPGSATGLSATQEQSLMTYLIGGE
ncbi:MAG: organic solvent transporter substrate-binding protein [Nocardioides sp.]|nr:organic solvent transporter substrate-binding protein [Nocardioides sp.]